jgi:tRNA (Thr-GGU) A37 N-methylase
MGDKSIPERGVLATRSPCRPNPIGITLVKLLSVDGTILDVAGLDALNESPLLDIKPYEEHFDSPVGIEWEKTHRINPQMILIKFAFCIESDL